MTQLTTARLRLVPFADDHLDGLYDMNRDAEVMRYITGKPETREQTQASIERVQARWTQWGYSWWSWFNVQSGQLIGAGCVQHLGQDKANPHELGWRLRRDQWGKGYATEAALAMAAFAFEVAQAPLLVAIRHPDNQASCRVMDKLGMRQRAQLERWHDMDCAVHEVTARAWFSKQ